MLYTLIRSKRKTLSIQISRNSQIIVRAPESLPVAYIENYIQQKQDWIEKAQKKIAIVNRNSFIPDRDTIRKEEIQKLKKKLMPYILAKIDLYTQSWDFPPISRVSITASYSRWGSCSSKNSLNFSFRLAYYLDRQPECIDAVIVHELCHLIEKNHSKNFWRLVYRYYPDYKNTIQYLH